MIRRNTELRLALLAALACVVLGALSVLSLRAASQTATVSLFVQVRPEARLLQQGDAVQLKVRLAPGAQAWIWSDGVCGSPASGALPISRSGSYVIPLSALSSTAGGQICLVSSDGALRISHDLKTR